MQMLWSIPGLLLHQHATQWGQRITTFNKLTVRQNSGYQLPVYRLCSFQMGGTPGGDVNWPPLTDRFLCLLKGMPTSNPGSTILIAHTQAPHLAWQGLKGQLLF